MLAANPQLTNISNFTTGSPRIPLFCKPESPFQAQYKLAAIYSLPYDIQTSAAIQSYPGTSQTASFVYGNAAILPSLGRNLASCGAQATCTGTSTINVLPSGLLFEKRYVQADIRFAKSVKIGRSKVQGIMDLFNAFNARPVLSVNTRYSGTTGGSWLSPQTTLVGRLIKFSAQVNF